MIGRAIANGFITAREFVAKGLLRVGVTPNALTLAGTAFTIGAGCCLAAGGGDHFAWTLRPGGGASAYPILAAALIILSSACDMLDGAVARLGNLKTPFGAFLDSTLDRVSDFAVFAGAAVYYAWATPANITFVLLSMIAFFNGFMISYSRARAEESISKCSTGYWQRGERSAAVLISLFGCNLPAMLIQQAILPAFTVLRRIVHTWQIMNGQTPPAHPRDGGFWMAIRLWRWPRMSWPYDLVTGANIAWLIFANVPAVDVLRRL